MKKLHIIVLSLNMMNSLCSVYCFCMTLILEKWASVIDSGLDECLRTMLISDISLHFQHYILYFILMSDLYQYHDSTFKHSEPICFMLSKNNGSTIIFKLDHYIV
jgi:hypothetical protein